MLGNKQNQQGGDHSFNIQGQSVVVNKGLSYSEVKEVALDTFQANFYKLANDAANLAKQRAEELTVAYLEKLKERDSSSIDSMKEPDMQYALYVAQKEYARTGDKDLSEMLVDILVERSTIKERSLMQIVLNECLEIVPKLTAGQLDILSLVFIFKYTRSSAINSFELLASYIKSIVYPFISKLTKENSHFQHLEYTGCGSISIAESKLEEIFLRNYPGLFSRGFSVELFKELIADHSIDQQILINCLHNSTLVQVNAIDDNVLTNKCAQLGINEEITNQIKSLHNNHLMGHMEVQSFLIDLCPNINSLFDFWNNSSMKNMTLTSVGIALGHANIRRKTKENFNLSIWIK